MSRRTLFRPLVSMTSSFQSHGKKIETDGLKVKVLISFPAATTVRCEPFQHRKVTNWGDHLNWMGCERQVGNSVTGIWGTAIPQHPDCKGWVGDGGGGDDQAHLQLSSTARAKFSTYYWSVCLCVCMLCVSYARVSLSFFPQEHPSCPKFRGVIFTWSFLSTEGSLTIPMEHQAPPSRQVDSAASQGFNFDQNVSLSMLLILLHVIRVFTSVRLLSLLPSDDWLHPPNPPSICLLQI